MLEGIPALGWFARLLTKRSKGPSTTVNITVHGNMVNSSVNINLPPRSELQIGAAESAESEADALDGQRNEG